MTGMLWQSACVAALFAIHPLHVESVAWAAERKDVLSACFWLLTIWAYLRYVQSRTWQRYVMTLVCFALGLMSKQMLVTLPFVLLLLDYWPLGQMTAGQAITPVGSGSQAQESAPVKSDGRKKKRYQKQPESVPQTATAAAPVAGIPWHMLLVEENPFFHSFHTGQRHRFSGAAQIRCPL